MFSNCVSKRVEVIIAEENSELCVTIFHHEQYRTVPHPGNCSKYNLLIVGLVMTALPHRAEDIFDTEHHFLS